MKLSERIEFLLIPILLVILTLSGVLINSAWAQSDVEERKKQLEAFYKKHPDVSRKFKPARNGRIEIPEKVLKEIRFGFEKRMALAGHGVLFDSKGRRVEIRLREAEKIQRQMLKAIESEKSVSAAKNREARKRIDSALNEIDKALDAKDLKPMSVFALRHLKLRAMAYRLRPDRRNAYIWRTDHLWLHAVRLHKYHLEPRFVATRDRLSDAILVWFGQTDYMRQCANLGVPVPPNFALSGTQWRHQGDLGDILLGGSGVGAQVWTWAKPSGRGGCVALPRGQGGPNDLAGIICQSAETGNACFWDNKEKGSGDIIPWGTQTLRINEMQDATELSPCTNCHVGNNVFIVSPDDPTWCRLLRGGQTGAGCSAVTGPNSHNFTLQVEALINPLAVSGTGVQHPRYIPYSGSPSNPAWTNDAAVGCGAICHLNGSGGGTPNPMPPACGVACN